MVAPLGPRAVAYGWRELARRAGLSEAGTEVSFHYGEPSALILEGGPSVVVRPTDPENWERLRTLPERRLESMPLRDALPIGAERETSGSLPVLFRSRGSAPGADFARLEGRTLVFDCDIVAATLFLLTRWEESQATSIDAHGRMPHTDSVAYRQGFLHRPLVDEYGMVLREWLKVLLPGWKPRRGRFAVRLSHDIDVVAPFWSLGGAARSVAAGILRGRSPAETVQKARLALVQGIAPRRTADYTGIFRLAEISRRYRVASAFYFMAADRGPYDSAYDIGSRPVRDAIHWLRSLGFEIGFHASYETFSDPSRLIREKARLDTVLGESALGGRQHYLRFRVPETWREWEAAGLRYDSTLTYAGHEGFRCGTCHAYRPFDMEADRELRVEELPLIVMDGTLRLYRGLTAAEAVDSVLDLARRCRDVEGTFTLLWHNSSLAGAWQEWGLDYEALVAKLAALERQSQLEAPAGASREIATRSDLVS